MRPDNPYQKRWRWWYPSIADAMLRNPDHSLAQIAKDLGKSANTIYYITATDMFKDFLAQRRKQWETQHDGALVQKTMKVANSALDVLSDAIEKKRDTIPLAQLSSVAFSALDRLGYSPNKPAPPAGAVTVNAQNAQVIAVSPDALREAQDAIRLAQSRRQAAIPVLPDPIPVEVIREEPLDFSALDDNGELRDGDEKPAAGLPRTISSD